MVFKGHPFSTDSTMAASAEMPYFIKPSQPLSQQEKQEAYALIRSDFKALVEGEPTRPLLLMATLNCLLKTHLPYAYWVGFYLWDGQQLVVGPYQGTLGCLTIAQGRGVCGRAFSSRQTIIVEDTHALQEGTEHIACDPNSASEIVVPLINVNGDILGVLDIDSTLKASFDETDKTELEHILAEAFAQCLHIPL